MSIVRKHFVFWLLAPMLCGCGTFVPDIQEFWGTPQDATYKVNKISAQVVCELRRAVQRVIYENKHRPVQFVADPRLPPPKPRNLDWFDSWGAQVTLSLNIIENTGITPGLTFITPLPTMQTYSTGLGGSLTSTATRTDKINYFYLVKDLHNGTPSMDLTCIPSNPANADLFIQSDLKLYDWLSAALLPYDISVLTYQNASGQNAISHEVKFEIVSNGNVTPTWKLVRLSANSSGTLLAAGRDRTQDLTITFGPIQQSGKSPPQLATPAENAHLATQIGNSVQQAIQTSSAAAQ
jgi:hypothetical protein